MFSILLRSEFRRHAALGLIATLAAAIFATGYHHPDEYMQIVEFANLHLGGAESSFLPWEFHETMRPYLIPGLFYLLVKSWAFIGVTNPFFLIGFFHFLSGLLGFLAMSSLATFLSELNLEKRRREFLISICFALFALPWLFTRGSSEAFSGSLFLLSLVMTLRGRFLWAGVVGGGAFEARYQAAFLLLGLLLFLLINKDWRGILRYAAGSLIVVGLSVLVDRWGYGAWVFPPWNYFYQNVVLNKSAQWGTSPFFAYLYMAHGHGGFLITGLLMVSFFGQLKAWKINPVILPVGIFIIGHSLIGHKEMRFLFPLLPLAPLILANDTLVLDRALKSKYFPQLRVYNFVLMAFLCLWPSRAEVLAQRFMWNQFRVGDMVTHHKKNLYSLGDNPVNFVKPRSLFSMEWGEEGVASFSSTTGVMWFLSDQSHQLVPLQERLAQLNCHEAWRAMPQWFENFNFGNWLDRAGNWSVYKCLE